MKTHTNEAANLRAFAIASLAIAISACTPSRHDQSGPCDPGTMQCTGNELQSCRGGTFQDVQACPTTCSPTLGCTSCVPGTGTCDGDLARTCNAAGTGFVETTCDPMIGQTCSDGVCAGACTPGALGLSYIGCDYYPTVTGNLVGDNFDFAVAIANTASTKATVTIDGGALATSLTVSVPAGSLVVQKLPWQRALKQCNMADTPSAAACNHVEVPVAGIVTKGAYHLRSDTPITVYQFNSLEYSISASDFSYSNDASLMLPTNVWRDSYYAAAWQGQGDPAANGANPSELAITAMQDNTTVTINSRATTVAGGGAPAFAVGTPQSVILNAGDVIELSSDAGDFTGTSVTSSDPIQVIGGHYCADVPTGVGYCDHLEESMFGVDTLGTRYVINAPAVTSLPGGKVEVIRVIATQPGTTLTYMPPQIGAPTTIANAGDFIEISDSASSFVLTANNKVLVAQYMEGQDAGGDTGDPAMALAVPVEQFRTSYLFHAPTSYTTNYVDVTAPAGASIILDGTSVTLTPIGGTSYQLGRVVPLGPGPNNDGSHNITGTMPFGITVYGYGLFTSYWYPGGLDLTTIIE